MGTETLPPPCRHRETWGGRVKLNNPLMGTETWYLYMFVSSPIIELN